MAYLITGGTGFLGSNVARHLLEKGQKVVVCDISPDGDVVSVLKSRALPGQLRISQVDVSKKGSLHRLMEAQPIDTIIHMACLLTEDCSRDCSRAIEVNCLGTAHVLEAAVRYGVSRLIWGSSIAAGEQRSAGDVNQLPSWALIYIATMTFNEHLTRVYREKFALSTIGLRFPYIYGVGRLRGASFPQKMLARALEGKSVHVPFGDEVLNWLYIEDAVRAVACALACHQTHKVSYTVSGDLRSMRDAAAHLREICPGADITLDAGRTGLNWQHIDPEIATDLAYTPTFSLEQGIAAMRHEMRLRPLLSIRRPRSTVHLSRNSRPAASAHAVPERRRSS